MARQKSAADKIEDQPQPTLAAALPRTVSIEEFITTRDRVVHGLSSLQGAIANLLNAYLDHCRDLVGDAYPTGVATNINSFQTGSAGPQMIDAGLNDKGKKKRVKKEKDPNAPKRPLTAAFLYATTARPIVKADLERDLPEDEKLGANAVNEEVNRRWNALPEEDKASWKREYAKNFEQYKKDSAAYEAKKKAEGIDIDAEAEEDVVAGAAGAESDAEGSDDDEVREPSPKEPTPPPAKQPAKRRKVTKENGVSVPVSAAAATPGSATAVPLPGTAEPAEKVADKKKGAKKAAPKSESPVATKSRAKKAKADEEPEAPIEEKKPRGRKRKSEA